MSIKFAIGIFIICAILLGPMTSVAKRWIPSEEED